MQAGTIPQRSLDLLTPVKINAWSSGGIITAAEERKWEGKQVFHKRKRKTVTKNRLVAFQNASEVIYVLYKKQSIPIL